jgi:hypothetical protein
MKNTGYVLGRNLQRLIGCTLFSLRKYNNDFPSLNRPLVWTRGLEILQMLWAPSAPRFVLKTTRRNLKIRTLVSIVIKYKVGVKATSLRCVSKSILKFLCLSCVTRKQFSDMKVKLQIYPITDRWQPKIKCFLAEALSRVVTTIPSFHFTTNWISHCVCSVSSC